MLNFILVDCLVAETPEKLESDRIRRQSRRAAAHNSAIRRKLEIKAREREDRRIRRDAGRRFERRSLGADRSCLRFILAPSS